MTETIEQIAPEVLNYLVVPFTPSGFDALDKLDSQPLTEYLIKANNRTLTLKEKIYLMEQINESRVEKCILSNGLKFNFSNFLFKYFVEINYDKIHRMFAFDSQSMEEYLQSSLDEDDEVSACVYVG